MTRAAPETLSREELAQRLRAQGVPREHLAFRCWRCGTVQSLTSFALAGVDAFTAERQIGYSCVGRHTGAGGWDPSSPTRALTPRCDWSISEFPGAAGLRIVEGARAFWAFAVATPDEARALMARGGQLAPPAPPEVSAATQGQPEVSAATQGQPARRARARRTTEAR